MTYLENILHLLSHCVEKKTSAVLLHKQDVCVCVGGGGHKKIMTSNLITEAGVIIIFITSYIEYLGKDIYVNSHRR